MNAFIFTHLFQVRGADPERHFGGQVVHRLRHDLLGLLRRVDARRLIFKNKINKMSKEINQ